VIKLLIADDESTVREYIKFVIRENNIPVKIEEAGNGLEAVEKAKKFKPDVLLLDIRMPRMDGLKAASLINRCVAGVKMAVLTAYDEFDYAREALRLGVSEYLLKPIPPAELIHFLKKALREKNAVKNCSSGISRGILELESKLMETIKLGERQKTLKLLEVLLKHEKLKDYTPDQLQKYFIELTGMIIRSIASLGIDLAELEKLKQDCQQQMLAGDSTETLKAHMEDFVLRVLALLDTHCLSPGEKIILKARAYIEDNYSRKIGLEDVAEHINLSPHYFSRLFKKHIGINFVEYVNRVRIEKAREYITNMDLSLKEVSEKVGFDNLSYFSSVFLKYTGCLPSSFRKSLLQKG